MWPSPLLTPRRPHGWPSLIEGSRQKARGQDTGVEGSCRDPPGSRVPAASASLPRLGAPDTVHTQKGFCQLCGQKRPRGPPGPLLLKESPSSTPHTLGLGQVRQRRAQCLELPWEGSQAGVVPEIPPAAHADRDATQMGPQVKAPGRHAPFCV